METLEEGNGLVVRLPRHFVGPVATEAFGIIRANLKTRGTDFVFDFSKTDFIDSSGVGILVSIAKELRNNGAHLSLRGLNAALLQLFVDTGLDKIFDIEKDDGVKNAEIDIFEHSVDIKLDIQKETEGDACILRLKGVMNHNLGSRYFKQQFLLALANGKKILLDFEDLTFFDSLSVSMILNLNLLLKETGGSLRICNANYIVKDLFSTLNIDAIIPLYSTRSEALEDWK